MTNYLISHQFVFLQTHQPHRTYKPIAPVSKSKNIYLVLIRTNSLRASIKTYLLRVSIKTLKSHQFVFLQQVCSLLRWNSIYVRQITFNIQIIFYINLAFWNIPNLLSKFNFFSKFNSFSLSSTFVYYHYWTLKFLNFPLSSPPLFAISIVTLILCLSASALCRRLQPQPFYLKSDWSLR